MGQMDVVALLARLFPIARDRSSEETSVVNDTPMTILDGGGTGEDDSSFLILGPDRQDGSRRSRPCLARFASIFGNNDLNESECHADELAHKISVST